ncbi:hypothetical protein SCLCIDRAFT_1213562 [Scleroderma citrinum Foug A]|uniref:Uncharacterized protein n=1 Tax=Scleroderma citrinum Foug A TaxID=1036808 RepID=A0A0C3E843_9AGAM|nr:hypothetical protein SCLCIDRAFT_1213562 [Scleroderma citrinum Foug A]
MAGYIIVSFLLVMLVGVGVGAYVRGCLVESARGAHLFPGLSTLSARGRINL